MSSPGAYAPERERQEGGRQGGDGLAGPFMREWSMISVRLSSVVLVALAGRARWFV